MRCGVTKVSTADSGVVSVFSHTSSWGLGWQPKAAAKGLLAARREVQHPRDIGQARPAELDEALQLGRAEVVMACAGLAKCRLARARTEPHSAGANGRAQLPGSRRRHVCVAANLADAAQHQILHQGFLHVEAVLGLIPYD